MLLHVHILLACGCVDLISKEPVNNRKTLSMKERNEKNMK